MVLSKFDCTFIIEVKDTAGVELDGFDWTGVPNKVDIECECQGVTPC